MANKELPPNIPEEGPIPVGSIIRAKRQAIGLSIGDFAKAIKYSSGYLNAIELGLTLEGRAFRFKAARVLGFKSPEELVGTPREEVLKWLEDDDTEKSNQIQLEVMNH